MRIGVPKETAAGERRVALVPDTVGRLVKSGVEVVVEQGAGAAAFFADAEYARMGATIVPTPAEVLGQVNVVLKVQRPSLAEAALLPPGTIVIGLLAPAASPDVLARLGERGVTALAMELVPRITRAQSMDALSSQATVAGYQAVLLGATRLAKLLPMLTTAAGTLAPAKVFVLGAGVAGLQAIATARRLGGIVSAFDVRPAVREQVQSLGATFVAAETVAAEGQGGYAKELAEDQQRRVLAAVGGHVKDMDLVVTTAQVPGRPAPRLITEEMVASMRPGSVIVDLAAETGGNCALTRLGETVVAHGVTILGPRNLPSSLPLHASQMYSRNLQAVLQHVIKDGQVLVDAADEIVGPMLVVHEGKVRN
jgi:NAD(P) transhydrogenase subunit alpha